MTLELLLVVFGAIFGAVAGSTINMLAYRYPRMRKMSVQEKASFNLAWPASHCPQCKTPLKWWHNIPVLSWLLLKGRCGACRSPIGMRYLIVELVAVALGVAPLWISPSITGAIIAFLGWGALAGIMALREGTPEQPTSPSQGISPS